MSEGELKACPLCDGTAAFATVQYSPSCDTAKLNGQSKFHYVSCVKCGTSNRGIVGHSDTSAAQRNWNTRPIEDRLTKEVERLKGEIWRLKEARREL